MHGAIVADALRVPWIPVAFGDTVLPFKWRDWLSTLDLPYEPALITPLYDNKRILDAAGQLKNYLKIFLKGRGIWSSRWGAPIPASSAPSVRPLVMDQLHGLVSRPPYLSDDNLIESLTVRYEDVLEKLRKSHCRQHGLTHTAATDDLST